MLSATQERGIELILKSKTIREVAPEIGVSETTIYRWLREDAEFKREYERAQDELREHISASVRACADLAVGTLRNVMGDLASTKVKERISAAKIILDTLYKDYERKFAERCKDQTSETRNVLDDLPDEAVAQVIDIINKYRTKKD